VNALLFTCVFIASLICGFKQGCQLAYFSDQKFELGEILEGLEIEDVCIFLVHLVYFTAILVYFVAIWHILWSFGMFYGHLVYFFSLGYIVP
jgi:hypothetical protein